MSRSRVVFLLALLVPAGATAGELELGVFAGRAIPTYEQTFNYNPGDFVPGIPGLSIEQLGTFGLTAKGGLAAGASLAFFPADAVGIEARVDIVSINVDATGVRYVATVTPAFPQFPPFSASLDLPPGAVDVDRLTPISLGVKLRSPGRVRLFLSAGGSYLPKVGATATQTLALGLSRFIPPYDVTRVGIRAEAQPGEGQSRWGLTAGIGLQVPIGAKVSLQAEARGFRFQQHALAWKLVEPSFLAELPEGSLAKSALRRLDPVEFKPTFYQATAGFAFRF